LNLPKDQFDRSLRIGGNVGMIRQELLSRKGLARTKPVLQLCVKCGEQGVGDRVRAF
jgi:hypothetical protein